MFDRIEAMAREAAAKNPSDVQALVLLSELLVGRGNYDEAFRYFNEALRLEPKNPRLLTSVARACRDMNEPENCLTLLRHVHEVLPQNDVITRMWKNLERVDAVFHELSKLGQILASDRAADLGPGAAPFVLDLNGDLLRVPADLLRYLWHTYHAKPQAIVPVLLAETGHYHWVQRALRPGDTVLDIGTNIGLFATMMSRAVGPAGQVHAFEPSPRIAADLKRVLDLNEMKNVIINQCAVSDAIGVARFSDIQEKDVRRESSHLDLTNRGDAGEELIHNWIEVPTITVDQYVSSRGLRPALLKIDVEGADLPVLRGADSTVRQFRPPIVLEIHHSDAAFFAELHGILAGWNYRFEREDKIYYCTPA